MSVEAFDPAVSLAVKILNRGDSRSPWNVPYHKEHSTVIAVAEHLQELSNRLMGHFGRDHVPEEFSEYALPAPVDDAVLTARIVVATAMKAARHLGVVEAILAGKEDEEGYMIEAIEKVREFSAKVGAR